MLAVEVYNTTTQETRICFGFSLEGALTKEGYNTPEWEVIRWEFLDN